jgi:hypothetical protein
MATLLLALAALAQDADRATVTLSSGERHEGAFSFTEGRKLELYDAQKSKRIRIDAAEIARVSVTVEEEKLEQGWMFKEESDHTKIKLPFKYPLRRLVTEVTLVSGDVLKGRVIGCVFYLETESDRKRFFFTSDQKGEKGQALQDLVYVKEVVLPNRKVGDKAAGTMKVPGTAAVVNIPREVSFQPPFTGLPSGRYDVFLFGETKVRYGLAGDRVPPEDLKAMQAKVDAVEEFFTKKRLVDAAREGNVTRVLVELTRPEESHDAGWRYARWEVWTFEPTQKSWDIRQRLFLHRARIPASKEIPKYEYTAETKLAGVPENAAIE